MIKSNFKCNSIQGLTEDQKYCQEWQGSLTWNGYGEFKHEGKTVRAHRFSYKYFVGKIPENLIVHHECKNRKCVNPKHLKAITQKLNIQLGLAGFVAGLRQLAKTHCPRKHKYDSQNTHLSKEGYRSCKKCRKEAYQRRIREGLPI